MSFSVVPPVGIGISQRTLAQMLAWAPADGTSCYVTNLPSGVKGLFQYDRANGVWMPGAQVLLDRSVGIVSGVNNTVEQYLKKVMAPGGVLYVGAEIAFEYTLARSDTVDAGTNANLKVGNAGGLADNSLGGSGFNLVSGTVRSWGNLRKFRVASATMLSLEGTVGTTTGSYVGNASSASIGDLNVGSTTADLYFSGCVRLAAATGTTLPQCGQFNLWLLPASKL